MLSEGPSKPFLAALCFCLAIALATVLISPPYQAHDAPKIETQQQSHRGLEGQKQGEKALPNKEGGGSNKTLEGDHEASEFWTILGRRVKITDTFLVVFTFTLFWATRNLVIGAERTAGRQLRAYLGVVVPKNALSGGIKPPAIPVMNLTLRNAGQTPAHKVVHLSGTVVDVYPLPDDYKFPVPLPTGPNTPTVMLPGTLEGVGINVTRAEPISDEEYDLIHRPGWRFYTYGTVQYEDAFGKPHYTNFCFGFFIKDETMLTHQIANIHNDAN